MATDAFQQLLGDTFVLHKSTTSIIIKRVVHRIAQLKPHYIKMPTLAETQAEKLHFYRLRRMPRVITDAIDCAHTRVPNETRKG